MAATTSRFPRAATTSSSRSLRACGLRAWWIYSPANFSTTAAKSSRRGAWSAFGSKPTRWNQRMCRPLSPRLPTPSRTGLCGSSCPGLTICSSARPRQWKWDWPSSRRAWTGPGCGATWRVAAEATHSTCSALMSWAIKGLRSWPATPRSTPTTMPGWSLRPRGASTAT